MVLETLRHKICPLAIKRNFMKKITVIILLFLAASVGSFAQSGFSAGIKGGPNFSTIEGGNANQIYSQRTGFHAGVFANIRLQRFGLQPEVVFSSQGAQIDLAQTEEKFNYVNVPILVKFYLTDFLNIQAGPQYGFMTSAIAESSGGNVNVESLYKDSDLSLALGVGIELPFGLNIEGRYNIGISDINDSPDTTTALNNQVYQVAIGFRFFDVNK